MSDLSKCKGNNCPLKNKCYRYSVKANSDLQLYITEYYEDGNCEFFLAKPETTSWYNVKET